MLMMNAALTVKKGKVQCDLNYDVLFLFNVFTLY